mmetsp:Transcript_6028/g.24909  ORF Transcript_6028/g.24909 Transcript_6028/m.24909 type:complete len:203 (-) Transcript_6028:233-841(-)
MHRRVPPRKRHRHRRRRRGGQGAVAGPRVPRRRSGVPRIRPRGRKRQRGLRRRGDARGMPRRDGVPRDATGEAHRVRAIGGYRARGGGGGEDGGGGCPGGTRVARDDEDGAPVLVDGGGGSASHVFFASASATAAVKASGFSPLNASTSAPPASLGPTIPLRSANLSRLVRDPNIFVGTGAASMTRERCTLQLSPSVPGALA